MSPNSKPKHIAFRNRNSASWRPCCFQFDTGKILTEVSRTLMCMTRRRAFWGIPWRVMRKSLTLWNIMEIHLFPGSADHSVRIWDIENANCPQVFHGHTDAVQCLKIVLPIMEDEFGRAQTKTQKTDAEYGHGASLKMPLREPLIISASRDSAIRMSKCPKSGDAHGHSLRTRTRTHLTTHPTAAHILLVCFQDTRYVCVTLLCMVTH